MLTEADWSWHNRRQQIGFPAWQLQWRLFREDEHWRLAVLNPDAEARRRAVARYAQRGRARIVLSDWLECCHESNVFPPIQIWRHRVPSNRHGEATEEQFYERVRLATAQIVWRANGRCACCGHPDRAPKFYGRSEHRGRDRVRLCEHCEERLFERLPAQRRLAARESWQQRVEKELRHLVFERVKCLAMRSELAG